MYFNERNDTSIDKEIKEEKKKNKTKKKSSSSKNKSSKKKKVDFLTLLNKYKIIIISLLLLIFGIILIIVSNRPKKYYLNLLGESNITYYVGEEYSEPGYVAYDNRKKDLTKNVNVIKDIDMDKVGKYTITYNLNGITQKRYINVIEKQEGSTSIHLLGDTNVYLRIGEKYTEYGYNVVDTVDGDKLQDKVKIENNIDSSHAGVYKVIYSVTNSSGITTSAVRNVIVIDGTINLSLNTTNYTNKPVIIHGYITDSYASYITLPDGSKTYQKSFEYKVTENGSYKFIVHYLDGKNNEKTINVSNIDTTAPMGTCTGFYKNGSSIINVQAKDNIGVSNYYVEGVYSTNNSITIKKELKVANVRIYDKAGNTSNISCTLYNANTSSNTNSNNNNTNNNNTNTNNNSNTVVNNKKMEIHFIASGHYDDAILIRTDNRVILIDGGRYRCHKNVIPYLQTLGIKRIDVMIGSQLSKESIASQAAILDSFEVGQIYYPDDIFTCASGNSCLSEDQEYIVDALDKHNKKPIIVKSPVRNIIGEMNLFFLAPTEIITNNGIANENSFIFILKYYNNTFMFTGDAPNRERNVTKLTETMNNLIRKSGISYPQGLDVDVLKYPHHGNTSFTDAFLSAVKPEYVIVPNYYAAKYPNADNQAMLNKYSIKTYKQSDSSTGNIVIISDGNNISIKMGANASDYKR